MKRFCALCLSCVLLCTALTGCYSYKDMNRMLFYTMGIGDYRQNQFCFFGEAFKCYRGEGEKTGTEKRVLMFGSGPSLTMAVEEMRSSVNYPIEYAGNKVIVFTQTLAEHGIGDYLDEFDRDQKPSLRLYFLVTDVPVEQLLSQTLEAEKYWGLFLFDMMNSQKDALGMVTTQCYEFLDNLNTGSRVNVLPILSVTTIQNKLDYLQSGSQSDSGGNSSPDLEPGRDDSGSSSSGQSSGSSSSSSEKSSSSSSSGQSSGSQPSSLPALDVPSVSVQSAAIFIGDKMRSILNMREMELYKVMTSDVHSGLINIRHPQYPDKLIGFSVLHSSHNKKVRQQDGRFVVQYTIKFRVVPLEAQKGLDDNPYTLHEIQQELTYEIKDRITKLIAKMKEQKIDLFNVKRMLELARIPAVDETYLDQTDFDINIDVTLGGTGMIKSSHYSP